MSGHTPGPWVVNGFGSAYWVIARTQRGGVAISSASLAGDEIADARLISAAPELLEALANALKSLDTDGAASATASLRTLGRAAIAKAEGRS